ncbi:MAG TPA: hypothetical protein PLG99_07400 [Kaistiaceae bacterium]|nr:hypothetical protein [Kaistiaceae bacterium]
MTSNDKAFAEPVRLSFFTSQGMLDATRPAREIEAILRVGGGESTSIGGSGSTSWRTRIVARKGEMHIDRTKYPDLDVRARDKVRALARPGQPWFEVAVVDDRGSSRLVLQLNEA